MHATIDQLTKNYSCYKFIEWIKVVINKKYISFGAAGDISNFAQIRKNFREECDGIQIFISIDEFIVIVN